MKSKVLYQTLKDRGNPEYILKKGPFNCNWDNTWLGEGYYFWDTFVENAHWWGEVRHKKKYIICKMTCDFHNNKCFDLVGDTDHMSDFSQSIEFLKGQGLINSETSVARILEFIKTKIGFSYEAIRVYGIKSISEHKEEYKKYRFRLSFELQRAQFLDYKPAIQICVFKKNGLNLRDLTIIYPDEYNLEYLG
ncbi:hypothetical protein [Tenacibaculum finnmarkense]|uniref:Uncharacterized protein n=1 Tax=Tenacibaculum finnmarkense genomovar finnmarkense TaxID=1458503 RepID=A0AAP1WHC1_9FLAO|nr:hypothetical protein [Tenacibaculum finnmarkense]MBE7653946.1 hypothetical protein [Tenacibaculum finnmarkense genomovar finnmarkense]MBE7696247.1 hypothetical protein [Tenacibaculum finnmarkense genomovar finnmarkense]MCD8428497.1 hypothetical protein [Tenacibaculum finnmarkense genomovar finnmarkense]MCG8732269.1 hypothetical protein [Tenacibaculum finnmarkense]MCG8752977.1 hypothetical protein [Tenacibaculum finnmarkense]